MDSLETSHPIEVAVGHPDEINQIFDSISYCKGSSIIRMLNDYIGNESFVKGLQNYLKRFMYLNATTGDLWKELSDSSGKDIVKIMEAWTKRVGYPVVQISKKVNENQHTIVSLYQQKFMKNLEASGDSLIWKVPITLRTKGSFPSVHMRCMMETENCEIDLGVVPESDWILLNCDYVGFYRSEYSSEMLETISRALEENPSAVGSSLDRIAILNDSFALVKINQC